MFYSSIADKIKDCILILYGFKSSQQVDLSAPFLNIFQDLLSSTVEKLLLFNVKQ